ncbi:unnamed protein product [Rhodiola kirilowii]
MWASLMKGYPGFNRKLLPKLASWQTSRKNQYFAVT